MRPAPATEGSGAAPLAVRLGRTLAIGTVGGAIGLTDIAVLTTCAIAGVVAGRLIRLPVYWLSGPLLASAFVHVAGINESAPPWEVVAVAQVVVGSAIGARFTGVPVHRVLGLTVVALVSTALMLAATVVFALVLAQATGLDWRPIALAYAPGGLAEMSLIALSLGIETAFVATHHVIRIGLIVVVAPLVFARIRRPGGQA